MKNSDKSFHHTKRISLPGHAAPVAAGLIHPVSLVGAPRMDSTYEMTPVDSAPNDSPPNPSADKSSPRTAGIVDVLLVVDAATVVEVEVVAGASVVEVGAAEVVVAAELEVLPPLIVLSLHETSSAPMRTELSTTRRTFIREVCQR